MKKFQNFKKLNFNTLMFSNLCFLKSVRTYFDFKDSLIIAVEDSKSYEVCIRTEPPNADIYFSKYGDRFEKQIGNEILIDSSYQNLFFYSDLKGYNRTEIKHLNFGYFNDSLLTDFIVYPNPFVKDLFVVLEFENNSAGIINLVISDLTGRRRKEYADTVTINLYKIKFDLIELEKGVYIISAHFGCSLLIHKIIKRE